MLDTNGNPVNNQEVDFALSTQTGGITLIPSRASTNNLGLVQTVVNSGTVSTTVRVEATVVDSEPTISSQSSVLVVSTGIPDQDSFSLSADVLNPEGWNRDGTEVQVTARLADAFNNPVPDGTAVSFTTEGGAIDPSCVTTNGGCTVTWRSQQPRPEGHVLGDVNKAGSIEINRYGLSLAEALSDVGGLKERTANANGVFVLRKRPVNEEGIIALGDFEITEGDRVVVCCLPQAIQKIEKLFL